MRDGILFRYGGVTPSTQTALPGTVLSCPHCRSSLVIGTIMETLTSRRACPKCAKEFLIENDVVRKPDSKKPSGSVGTTKAKKSTSAK